MRTSSSATRRYIGGKDMRAELGDGYAEGLWAAYSEVPESATS